MYLMAIKFSSEECSIFNEELLTKHNWLLYMYFNEELLTKCKQATVHMYCITVGVGAWFVN
jgi:hypothetical protein